MKFKEFRDLIFSPCYVEVGKVGCFVETHEKTEFDDYEVIGVRASSFDEWDERIVVSLAERDVVSDNIDASTIDTQLRCSRNIAQASK